MVKGAWVTLATNDSYSLGALVLAHSLKQVGTQQELAILITPGVTNSMRERLTEVFNLVKEVNILDSKDKENLRLLQRPELGITFTKLHCWQLTEYEKCVFLDADTMVLQNCDELFQREELSAAPDVGWPDCFNSGVFVYKPSLETYNNLIQFALDKGSFDGGDQGLLNLYFSDWAHKDISKHLPFIYNVCSTAFYSYLPAFKQYGKDMKIIHFIGNAKPWLQYFDTETKKVRPTHDVGHLEAILQMWWNIFCSMIHPNLSSDMISSYPSEFVMARSPDHLSHPSQESFAPSDCTNDVVNFWDPWEEYDKNQLNVTLLHSPEPLESHNTIALSPVADNHPPIGVILEEPPVHNNQPCIDISGCSRPLSNDQSCIQTFIEPCREENVLNENSTFPSAHTNNIDFKEDTNSPVEFSFPLPPQENSAIPALSVTSSPENLPRPSTEIPPEIEHIIPQETPPPNSYIPPCKYESEEAIEIENCEVENNVQESGLAGAFARLTLGQQRSPEQEALENSLRRQNWEQGNIDYLGRDSFDNIWSKICETLAKGPQEDEDNSAQITTEEPTLSLQPDTDSGLQEVTSQQVSSTADSSKGEITQEKDSTASTPSDTTGHTETAPTLETPTDSQLPTKNAEENLPVKVSPELAKESTGGVQETIASSDVTSSQEIQKESKAEDTVQVPPEEKSRPVASEPIPSDATLKETSIQQGQPTPDPTPTEAAQCISSIPTEKSLKETLPEATLPIETSEKETPQTPQQPVKETCSAEPLQIAPSEKPSGLVEASLDMSPKPADQICKLERTEENTVPQKSPELEQSPSAVAEPKSALDKASVPVEPSKLEQSPPTAGQTCSLEKTSSASKISVPSEATKPTPSPTAVSEPKASVLAEPSKPEQSPPTAGQTCSIEKTSSSPKIPASSESSKSTPSPTAVSEPKASVLAEPSKLEQTAGQTCSLEKTSSASKISTPSETTKTTPSPTAVSEPKASVLAEPSKPEQSPPTAGKTCSIEKTSSSPKIPVSSESSKSTPSPTAVSEPKASVLAEPSKPEQSPPTAGQTCTLEKTSSSSPSETTKSTPTSVDKTSQQSDSQKKPTPSAPQTPPAPTPTLSSDTPPPITAPPRKNGGKKNQTKSKK